jgi:glycosyltransferase involved in cell wall biosynthesis
MKQPLVSILIPAYNCEQWLADAIESALAQTWARKEVIVVDDGSSDRTLEIARRFASKTVHVASQDNQGVCAARNAAFAICQGDYVQWLDGDDVLAPEKVERQLLELRDGGTARTLLSGPWAYFIYRRQKARFSETLLCCDLTPLEWLTRKMGNNLHMAINSWLVSRELTEAAGPWDLRLWFDDDGEYFCRVILATEGIRFVPEAKSYYRRASSSPLTYIGGSGRKLESLFLSMKLHIDYLRTLEDSDRTRTACIRYIQASLFEFYPYRIDLADELKAVARALGGQVNDPRLSWKYNWLVNLFGWRTGRRAQLAMPRLRASATIAWDRALFALENRWKGRHSAT